MGEFLLHFHMDVCLRMRHWDTNLSVHGLSRDKLLSPLRLHNFLSLWEPCFGPGELLVAKSLLLPDSESSLN